MEFHYREGSIIEYFSKIESDTKIIMVDFFDTLLIRACSPRKVFQKVNPFTSPIRGLSEDFTYRFIDPNPTLETIARNVPFWTTQKEITAEIDSLQPNLTLIKELMLCQDLGIEIHVVSDTYFSSQQILHLLASKTDFRPDSITTSSEEGTSKNQGLYKLVERKLPYSKPKILVVGDNLQADGLNAIESGFSFAWITSKGTGISCLENLANESLSTILANFVDWLEENARSDRLDKLLFLSRDTWVIKSIWDEVFPDKLATQYLPASRRVAIASGFLKDGEDYSDYIGRRVQSGLLSDQGEKEEFKTFYSQHVFNVERIGIVDLGWNGTFQVALERAFPEKVFKGYYLGLLPHNPVVENKNGYLFSPKSPNPTNFKVARNYIDVLEILLCSNEGSLISLKHGGYREVQSSSDKLRNLIARDFQRALIEHTVENFESLHVQDLKIESLDNLGTCAPDWFIQGMAVMRHKIGPSDTNGQPLFISSKKSVLEASRIWWPIGQKRYLRFLRTHNFLRFIMIGWNYRLVQIFFILRVMRNQHDRKKVFARLRNFDPK